jgi:hypothetical protein
MKKVMSCWLATILFNVAFTQDSSKVIINAIKQNEQELSNRMYQYSQFVPGKAFFETGSLTESKFNYSYLTNKILFINAKGDTLELAHGENFKAIVIGVDTFCYYQQQFLQQLTHYPVYNLFLKRSLRYNGIQKKGAYGSYSETSSVTSYNSLDVNKESIFTKLTPDENLVYLFTDDYFFSGRYNQFYPATKKGVHELFSKNEKQFKGFFEENKINLNKLEDLHKILDFALTILQ